MATRSKSARRSPKQSVNEETPLTPVSDHPPSARARKPRSDRGQTRGRGRPRTSGRTSGRTSSRMRDDITTDDEMIVWPRVWKGAIIGGIIFTILAIIVRAARSSIPSELSVETAEVVERNLHTQAKIARQLIAELDEIETRVTDLEKRVRKLPSPPDGGGTSSDASTPL